MPEAAASPERNRALAGCVCKSVRSEIRIGLATVAVAVAVAMVGCKAEPSIELQSDVGSQQAAPHELVTPNAVSTAGTFISGAFPPPGLTFESVSIAQIASDPARYADHLVMTRGIYMYENRARPACIRPTPVSSPRFVPGYTSGTPEFRLVDDPHEIGLAVWLRQGYGYGGQDVDPRQNGRRVQLRGIVRVLTDYPDACSAQTKTWTARLVVPREDLPIDPRNNAKGPCTWCVTWAEVPAIIGQP